MKLDGLRVALTPRRRWEALDLGQAILGRWRGAVYLPWLAITLPLFGLIALALRQHPAWIALVIWWLKPLLGRIPLLVLSRAVFGPVPSARQVFAELPKLLRSSLGLALLQHRFSTRRSLVMPVDMLEQPKGQQRTMRLRVLSAGPTGGAASTSLVLFLHFELCLYLSLAALLLFFGPADWTQSFVEMAEYGSWTDSLHWILAGSYAASVLFLEPAFVAAGFGLYLCRRTQLEGWDLELGFRQLADRLQAEPSGPKAPRRRLRGARALLLLPLCLGLAGELRAQSEGKQPTQERIEAVVEEVLDQEEFDTTITSTRWVPDERDSDMFGGLMSALAPVLVVFAWVGAAALVIVLAAWLATRGRGGKGSKSKAGRKPPEQAFGLDLRPQSLPKDLAGEARALWNQGQVRDALSLLYRGALTDLVQRDELDIIASDTERDCVERVSDLSDAGRAEYFRGLTDLWLHSAWGARPPGLDQANTWCDAWAQHFGGDA